MTEYWPLLSRRSHDRDAVRHAIPLSEPAPSEATRSWRRTALALGPVLVLGGAAFAQDVPNIELTIKDHRFTPAEIHVSAHTPTVLVIKNEDPMAEEFDSAALKVEKVIAGGGTGMVRLRPLDTGSYPFMGEYHSETAQGVVIVQ